MEFTTHTFLLQRIKNLIYFHNNCDEVCFCVYLYILGDAYSLALDRVFQILKRYKRIGVDNAFHTIVYSNTTQSKTKIRNRKLFR